MIFLPPGKSYVFLRNFEKALLEILMCSSLFCLSWKIYMCILPFLVLLENLMCSYKRIVSGKLEVFLLCPSLMENLCVLEISLKKSLLEKKNRYLSKIARRLLLQNGVLNFAISLSRQ